MNFLTVELLAIAILTALVCVIPGVFLVLRGVSLMSDAISHALLFGIVCMFLLVHSLTSPLLLVGAAGAGFVVVLITEYAMQRFKLHKDAAIGLFFPFFFSCAVILISLYARDVHLDTDMVLLGDMVFAPFMRWSIGGVDCGPQAIALIVSMLIISLLACTIMYRALVLSVFDALYARSVQAHPQYIYYCMMFLTSMVAVTVFSVVGSVVVVALMIAPAASAYCTARSVKQMIVHASIYSVCAAVSGYLFAAIYDLSIAGSIAVVTGIIFMGVILLAPRTGIMGKLWWYGTAWIERSLVLVEKYSHGSALTVQLLQKKYGWSKVWVQTVLWYKKMKDVYKRPS